MGKPLLYHIPGKTQQDTTPPGKVSRGDFLQSQGLSLNENIDFGNVSPRPFGRRVARRLHSPRSLQKEAWDSSEGGCYVITRVIHTGVPRTVPLSIGTVCIEF